MATLANLASFPRVTSPPVACETTEKVLLRCILTIKLSLVSCSPLRPGSTIGLFKREARIEAMACLQISHTKESDLLLFVMVAWKQSSF